LVSDLAEEGEDVVALEGGFAGEAFVEDDA
jgi:hypothetical protein